MKKLLPLFILLIFISTISVGRSLDEIRRSGVVKVAFTESGLQTVNYRLAQEFAKFINCDLEIVIVSWNEIFSKNGIIPTDYQTNDSIYYTPDALKKADFICGTTYIYDWREKFFDFAGIMDVTDLLIVSKRKTQKSLFSNFLLPENLHQNDIKINVKNYNDLKGLRIAFLENSSYATNLAKINDFIGGGITFVTTKSEEESQLLARQGKVDGFITVSYVGLQFVNDNSQFKLAFPIAKPDNVGWAVEKGNRSLRNEINDFFAMMKGSKTLDKLFTTKFGVSYDSYNEIINSYSESTEELFISRDYDEIMESGKLIVGLRDREMVYHSNGIKQFNHYLAEDFAKYLGLDLEIRIIPNLSDYFLDSKGNIVRDSSYTPEWFNNIDVACDLLAPIDWRLKKIDIVDVLPTANVVVARKDLDIKNINDLNHYRGVTSKGSVYEEALIDNDITNYYYKEANEFFSEIMNGKADYCIVNFDIYSLPKYPTLESKFILGEISPVGWGIKKNQPKLRQKILEFLVSANSRGILDAAFMEQAGIPYKAAQNHLNAMYQTYQTGYFPFVFYGSEQGLPQEDIMCIFQDNQGFMWFGTQAGAIKFNGRKMLTFPELANNIVFDIAQDKKGKIYFATLKGISCLNEDGTFTQYSQEISFKHIYIDKEETKYFYGDKRLYTLDSTGNLQQLNKRIPALPDCIHAIAQNRTGRTTLIASPDGLFELSEDEDLNLIFDKKCYSVFVDEDGIIWLSTTDGVYTGNLSQFRRSDIEVLKINNKVGVPEKCRVHTIKQNRDGSIFLISDFEAFQLFSLNQSAIRFDQSIGLKNLKLLSYFEDKEDNYWFGFSGGIQKLTNRSLRNLYPEILDSYLNNFEEDAYGRIWMAFNNKIYYFQHELVDFSYNLDGQIVPYVVKVLNNDEIFFADSYGWMIFDAKSLKLKRKFAFKNKIHNLKNIFQSSKGDIFLLTGVDGVIYHLSDFESQPTLIRSVSTSLVSQLVQYQTLVLGGNNTGIVKFDGNSFDLLKTTPSSVLSMATVGDLLYVGMEDGIGIYNEKGDFKVLDISTLPSNSVNSILQAKDKDYLWLGTNAGFCYYNIPENRVEFSVYTNDGLPGNEIVTNGLLLNKKGVLYVATFHGVSSFDLKKENSEKFVPQCRLENILLNGLPFDLSRNKFNYSENNFVFELAGLSFKDESALIYEFYMKGLDNDYVASSGKEHRANYQNLPPGKYEFVYRAKGKDGIWSYSNSYKFEIKRPFYRKWWFMTIVILSLAAIVYFIIKMREAQLRKRNEHLEMIVNERTSEIKKQKDAIEQKNAELETQREEILLQRDAIEEKNATLEQQKTEILSQRDELEVQKNIATQQRDEIAHHQKEIMDSIYYAKRIQTALLPISSNIAKVLPEHFILFKPRDIVSGDFYYFKQVNHYAVIVAADCTGHGVPGAFMSMLGSAYLNEIIVKTQDELNSGHILDLLRSYIIESLHQTGRFDEAKDGMDIALCVLDTDTNKLQFSGAFNPMFLVRDGDIEEYRADRMPIGIHDYADVGFTTYDVDMIKDDIVYIFSDGYASQFGGKTGKKFMTSRFKKLLLEISQNPLAEQREILDEKIENWMGGVYSQVDDILVIGFKIS
ncbi:MAG: transporter substrate-binding domain-containing protein [Bacteroidales bacterium]|nr:transporter substrate-binding domain-containing protein [Bacteroidales bacterium]